MIRADLDRARIPRRSPEEHEEKLRRSAGMMWRLLAIAVGSGVLAAVVRALGIAG